MHKTKPALVPRRYLTAFALITSLFFLWGFARSILDVLNKHFQEQMHVSLTASTLVQGSTYLAYALMAIPAGLVISRWGYRRGLVAGLAIFAVGCFLFIPGALSASFPLFLAALFLIGCGLASLEVSANPYSAELGDPGTAASRLNLSQAFNGLGCMLGPVIVGGYLFSAQGASVAVPYGVMGLLVAILALVFSRVPLPAISPAVSVPTSESDSPKSDSRNSASQAADTDVARQEGFGQSAKALWRSRRFLFGFLALFFYEAAEIGINSIFMNYATEVAGIGKVTATAVLSFGALGLFMVARLVGSAVMRRIDPEKVLAVCGAGAVCGSLLVAFGNGVLAATGLFCCYAFESIMFPTIFALTIEHSGPRAKTASAFLMMTPLGGAVGAMLMGWTASAAGLALSFMVPAVAFAVVLCYAIGLMAANRKTSSHAS